MKNLSKNLGNVDDIQRKLYEFIWKRTIASQMTSAEIQETRIDIGPDSGDFMLRASGSETSFDGFKKVYFESADTEDDRDKEITLVSMREGEKS